MHISTCSCSVCWARNYCDALVLFPDPEPAFSPPLPPDYYKFYDCTAEFLSNRECLNMLNSARFPNHTPA